MVRMEAFTPLNCFNKFMKISIILAVILSLYCLTLNGGHPCAHVLLCCRTENKGTKFLVNGKYVDRHDYGDIEQVSDILQKIKDAGIKTVIVDMTNPSQWTVLRDEFLPMVENIYQVCVEKDLQFFMHIGGGFTPEIIEQCGIRIDYISFWDGIAKEIWERWAQLPEYRMYGYGDERPILIMFRPASDFWVKYERAPVKNKQYLEKFRKGTVQINEPIYDYAESDGWGYRNKWQNKSGSVRFVSPNGGVHPVEWHKVHQNSWREQIRWAKEASEYSIYGSYDDACDAIFWGIADTSMTTNFYNRYPEPANHRYYYDVLQNELTN